MADFTIFYSWQNDAPEEINWRFIEKAVREAVDKIKAKNGLPYVPIVDLGMERVPGSPEIATIMFRKIGRSAIFVGDVSLVGEIKGDASKKVPNGNVSVEMGYAAAYLGWERIICVLNEHYGKAEEQPVDTRNRRFPINYALPPSRDNEAEVFKGLVNDLHRAIHAVYIYDLESAKEAIRLLDINCMNLIAAAAKCDCFPPQSQRDDNWWPLGYCQVQCGRDSLPRLGLDLDGYGSGAGQVRISLDVQGEEGIGVTRSSCQAGSCKGIEASFHLPHTSHRSDTPTHRF